MIFKTIPNHIKYEISEDGKVRHRKIKRILKPTTATNGYLQVGIYSDKKQRSISKCIHHLISMAYMDKRPEGYELQFKDRDKKNVSLKNLQYVPFEQNRPKKYPARYCKRCGKQLKSGYKNACSNICRWFLSRVLVECNYCGREFYRKKSVIKACTIENGYTLQKTYCTKPCVGKAKSKQKKHK